MAPAYEADISDEKLVAFLDGELGAGDQAAIARALSENADIRARLAVLAQGGRRFDEAFELLLEAAPDDKLQAMLSGLLAERAGLREDAETEMADGANGAAAPFPGRAAHASPLWGLAAAASILALVFAGGFVTGGLLNEPQTQQAGEQKPGWREAAARYVALFSKETLEGMPRNPEQREANLRRLETALGLPLGEDRLAAAELSFQGTQLLQLEGEPLAQISYLHDGRTPVALCIIRSSNPPAAPVEEKRHGLNVVHWVAGGYGFMLIGDVSENELARMADMFRRRFS